MYMQQEQVYFAPTEDKLVAGAIEAFPELKVWRMRDGDEDEDEDEKSDGINYEVLQRKQNPRCNFQRSPSVYAQSLQLAARQDEVVDLLRLFQIKGSKCRGYGSGILHLAGRLALLEYNFNKSLRGVIQNNFRHRSGAGKVVGSVSEDVVTVVTHFSDPRITSAELRDLLLQSISVLVQYKEYPTAFESNLAAIHSLPIALLSAFDNRSWIPVTDILVQLCRIYEESTPSL
ncbi:hypothetical protein Tco_1516758 [Tanacetum coccineum]